MRRAYATPRAGAATSTSTIFIEARAPLRSRLSAPDVPLKPPVPAVGTPPGVVTLLVIQAKFTAGAWMVLKRVENSPQYRRLLEDTLLSVARARGFNSLLDADFEQVLAEARAVGKLGGGLVGERGGHRVLHGRRSLHRPPRLSGPHQLPHPCRRRRKESLILSVRGGVLIQLESRHLDSYRNQ